MGAKYALKKSCPSNCCENRDTLRAMPLIISSVVYIYTLLICGGHPLKRQHYRAANKKSIPTGLNAEGMLETWPVNCTPSHKGNLSPPLCECDTKMPFCFFSTIAIAVVMKSYANEWCKWVERCPWEKRHDKSVATSSGVWDLGFIATAASTTTAYSLKRGSLLTVIMYALFSVTNVCFLFILTVLSN